MTLPSGASVPGARLGLLADTHGRVEIAAEAARLLVDAGADRLVHLGDVGGKEVLEALLVDLDAGGAPRPPVHVVFGNTDFEIDKLARFAHALGIRVEHPVGELRIGGKIVVFQHGDDAGAMRAALDAGADYLCHGHTHERRDERLGGTRVVNPGALHRAREHTVAVLDVARDAVSFLTIPRTP
jgi:hypothetical protein